MSDAPYEDLCDYEFVASSGTASNDVVVLAYRKPAATRLSPFELESWIVRYRPLPEDERKTRVVYEYGKAGWMTGIWRSIRGPVYVSDIDGTLRICRDLDRDHEDAWEELPLDVPLAGVWGLSDEWVFTWGRSRGEHRMFRFDGREAHPMPSPGDVAVMHGLSPDLLYAAGVDGLVARWDGRTWERVVHEGRGNVTGLFVVSPDEWFATTEQGELWHGTPRGWSVRARSPEPLLAVVRFEGAVWVAGDDEGLLRLDETTNELERVKPELFARALEARGSLLVTAHDFSGRMVEGMKVRGLDCDGFARFCAKTPPLWLETS